MNTRFLFRGVEIYKITQEYVLKRLQRIAKLVDPISKFDIEIGRDKKGKFRVEIMVKTPHNLYRAEEVTQSVEGSTDIAVDELEGQIDKRKNRNRDLKLRGNRSIKKRLILDPAARF
jgi:ribosomal subunit interface protein